MAFLSTSYHPLYTYHNHRTTRQSPTRHGSRSLTVMSCRKQKLPEESQGAIRRTVAKIVSEVGKKMKPEKKKGDIKDLMLMSLSFAVYVYISQLIVCAYFAWRHVNLPNPSW